ncbi:hypothetical protein GCM10027271_04050 [Saccharopolyspora gloriosae]|uniref:Uncharacterized protein n=1 Tax=Saccharopolyspora gloriosae TaxID=455344 RepID=A0A840NPQ5_9PSEU|nr:hypothetical protein [Saccharopolyspora gloriosae]MBB5071955.1 hypothetical protein [Saccharopolyspora gloriosae]
MRTQSVHDEIAERRPSAASGRPKPNWLLRVFAVVVLGVGAGTDLRPDLSTQLTYVLIASVVILVVLPRWKGFAAARGGGRSITTRSVGVGMLNLVLGRLVTFGLLIGYLVARVLLGAWEVPMPATIASALIVVTMPLWRRVAIRG